MSWVPQHKGAPTETNKDGWDGSRRVTGDSTRTRTYTCVNVCVRVRACGPDLGGVYVWKGQRRVSRQYMERWKEG